MRTARYSHVYTWPLFPISCLDSHSIGITLLAELTNPMTVREEFGALKCWENTVLVGFTHEFSLINTTSQMWRLTNSAVSFFPGLCFTCFLDDEFWLAEVSISSRSRQSFLQDIPAIWQKKAKELMPVMDMILPTATKNHVHSTGWLEIPKSQGCAERSRRREGS